MVFRFSFPTLAALALLALVASGIHAPLYAAASPPDSQDTAHQAATTGAYPVLPSVLVVLFGLTWVAMMRRHQR